MRCDTARMTPVPLAFLGRIFGGNAELALYVKTKEREGFGDLLFLCVCDILKNSSI